MTQAARKLTTVNHLTISSTRLSRRTVLAGSAGLAGAAALAGCSSGADGGSATNGGITWWDHNVNLQKANGAAYAEFTAASGTQVAYTYIQTAKLGQSLQLAKQSNQMPEIHSTAGLELSVPALIADGWFAPIEWADDVVARFGDDGLVEGQHVFDGKIYTFPIFADRQYPAAVWFNTDFISQAGIGAPPKTYDEFRDACRKVKAANDGAAGFVFALGHTGRMNEQINALAQAAGFEGIDGVRYATGEVAYDDDAYVTVFELFQALKADKTVFPGVGSLDDQTARTRWAAGAADYYLDGPWCSGTVQTELPQFLPKVGVGQMLVPDASTEVVAYRNISGGNYFISSGSKRPDQCAELLSHLVSPAYNVAVANAMAQPPYDLDAVAQSTAVQPWRDLVEAYASTVFLGPQANLANPDVPKVARFSKPVKPGLGDLLQGVYSGDVTDVRGALKTLSDAVRADREQAIAKAVAAGAEVSLDDYAFSNWKPRTDYTTAMYKK